MAVRLREVAEHTLQHLLSAPKLTGKDTGLRDGEKGGGGVSVESWFIVNLKKVEIKKRGKKMIEHVAGIRRNR